MKTRIYYSKKINYIYYYQEYIQHALVCMN